MKNGESFTELGQFFILCNCQPGRADLPLLAQKGQIFGLQKPSQLFQPSSESLLYSCILEYILLSISDHCLCRTSICWKMDIFYDCIFWLYLETCSLVFLAFSHLCTFLIVALFFCLCLNSFVISCWLMASSRNGCCCSNGF